MSQSTRTTTVYRVSKAAVTAGLGLSNVDRFEWIPPHLIAYHAVTIGGGPHPQVDAMQQLQTLTPWADIKAQFFSSVGMEKFLRMTMTYDSTYLYFDLNLEE